MNESTTHLTEEERQTLADGSISADRAATARAHLRMCVECSADVARLERLVTRARDMQNPTSELAELWPAIRARIDSAKVVTLAPESAKARWTGRRLTLMIATVAAALIVAAWLGVRARGTSSAPALAELPRDTAGSMALAADSVRAYEEEAQILLDRLALLRSVLEPGAAAAIDKDLAVIDSAIAELQTAIARDPRNPALRQLLADSYRQKVDVLKRVSNAG
jgi:anti-sigma factor ChrR (cupin superfamily)